MRTTILRSLVLAAFAVTLVPAGASASSASHALELLDGAVNAQMSF